MTKGKYSVIEGRTDRRRGCGWRKPGGLYLTADGPAAVCREPPIPLDICPTCGTGFPFHRGWKWVNGSVLAEKCAWSHPRPPHCAACPLAGPIGRCGLLWIGVRHYPRPADWLAEAAAMGISQRVRTIPPDLEIGRTWVMVAHRKAILNADGSQTAAVFQLFRPRAIEYVVADDDPAEKLAALVRRGITPVRIRRIIDTPMFGAMVADEPVARPTDGPLGRTGPTRTGNGRPGGPSNGRPVGPYGTKVAT